MFLLTTGMVPVAALAVARLYRRAGMASVWVWSLWALAAFSAFSLILLLFQSIVTSANWLEPVLVIGLFGSPPLVTMAAVLLALRAWPALDNSGGKPR